LDRSIQTIKKNTEALVVASKETELKINADKTKYMVMSRNKNEERNHRIKIDNIAVEGWNISNIWQKS
jgi:hypothetical protein